MSTALMHRTQIYLTPQERKALGTLAARTGRTQSDLIREALDRFLEESGADELSDRTALLRHGRGLWANRTDLPDFAALRREWDRYTLDDSEAVSGD
jgi:predicted DNA-binding protein